jgi:hypothetical protein
LLFAVFSRETFTTRIVITIFTPPNPIKQLSALVAAQVIRECLLIAQETWNILAGILMVWRWAVRAAVCSRVLAQTGQTTVLEIRRVCAVNHVAVVRHITILALCNSSVVFRTCFTTLFFIISIIAVAGSDISAPSSFVAIFAI